MAASTMSPCLGSRAHYHSSRSAPCRSAMGVCSPRQVAAARSLACSSQIYMASWDASNSNSYSLQEAIPVAQAATGAPRRQVVRLGNKAAGGVFAPLVVVVRSAMGEKEFNKLRGKAIAAHSQVIKDFCKVVGVDNKQVQGVIRLAKKNGEWLGFLS